MKDWRKEHGGHMGIYDLGLKIEDLKFRARCGGSRLKN